MTSHAICQTKCNVKSEKLTERITIRLSKSDLLAVEKYAKHHRLDPSDVLRIAAVNFLREKGLLPSEESEGPSTFASVETVSGVVAEFREMKAQIAHMQKQIASKIKGNDK